MKKSYLIILIIIVISFALGICLYPQMPEQMASHWNSQDKVDDYLPKFWGLFLMPLISLGLLLLFALIPKIDPLKQNIVKFRKYFDWFVILIILFLFYIYLLSLAWNLNYQFKMSQMIIPAIGLLFFYIGLLLKKAKRNWFIGIRTPWTLTSDLVWDKTHHLAGKLFKIAGLLAVLGIVFPQYGLWLVLIPVISFSIYTFIYSYFIYQKIKRV